MGQSSERTVFDEGAAFDIILRIHIQHAQLPMAFVYLLLLLQEYLVVDLPLGQACLESLTELENFLLHGRHSLF